VSAPATDRQESYLRDLLNGLLTSPSEAARDWADTAAGGVAKARRDGEFDKPMASDTIDACLAAKMRFAAPKPAAADDLPLGMYAEGDVFYKVVKSGTGNLYAKRLQVGDVNPETGREACSWEYEGKRPLYRLTLEHRLTEEQAKEFGMRFGICIRCTAELSKGESVHVGYGKTCAGREGWWYPTARQLRELEAAAAGIGPAPLFAEAG